MGTLYHNMPCAGLGTVVAPSEQLHPTSGASFRTAAPYNWWLLLNSCITQVVAPSEQLHHISGGSFWTAAPHKWWLLQNSCTTQVVAPSEQLHHTSGGSFWTAASHKWWLLQNSCTTQVVAPSEQLHHTSGGSFWTAAPHKWWLLLNSCTTHILRGFPEQLFHHRMKYYLKFTKIINCRHLLAECPGNRPISRPVRNDASYSPFSKKLLEMFVFGLQ